MLETIWSVVRSVTRKPGTYRYVHGRTRYDSDPSPLLEGLELKRYPGIPPTVFDEDDLFQEIALWVVEKSRSDPWKVDPNNPQLKNNLFQVARQIVLKEQRYQHPKNGKGGYFGFVDGFDSATHTEEETIRYNGLAKQATRFNFAVAEAWLYDESEDEYHGIDSDYLTSGEVVEDLRLIRLRNPRLYNDCLRKLKRKRRKSPELKEALEILEKEVKNEGSNA